MSRSAENAEPRGIPTDFGPTREKPWGGPHEYRQVHLADYPRADHEFYARTTAAFRSEGFRELTVVENVTLSSIQTSLWPYRVTTLVSNDGTTRASFYTLLGKGVTGVVLRLLGATREVILATTFDDGTVLVTLQAPPVARLLPSVERMLTHWVSPNAPIPALAQSHRQRVKEYLATHRRVAPLIATTFDDLSALAEYSRGLRNKEAPDVPLLQRRSETALPARRPRDQQGSLQSVADLYQRARRHTRLELLLCLPMICGLVGAIVGASWAMRQIQAPRWLSLPVIILAAAAPIFLVARIQRLMRAKNDLNCHGCRRKLAGGGPARADLQALWDGECTHCRRPIVQSRRNAFVAASGASMSPTDLEGAVGKYWKQLEHATLIPIILASIGIACLKTVNFARKQGRPVAAIGFALASAILLWGSGALTRYISKHRARSAGLVCPSCDAAFEGAALLTLRHEGRCLSCNTAVFRDEETRIRTPRLAASA